MRCLTINEVSGRLRNRNLQRRYICSRPRVKKRIAVLRITKHVCNVFPTRLDISSKTFVTTYCTPPCNYFINK